MADPMASPLHSAGAGVSQRLAPTGAPTRIKLNGVEAGRGVAALLVVFYHAALHVEGDVGGSLFWHLPHFGHAGVDFFFVLSGFIITFVHHQDVGRPNRLAHYVQRRFTRVLPFYWIVLAYYLADSWLFHPAMLPGKSQLLSNLLLLPRFDLLIVGGSWTLVFELLFYAIFAVMILSRKMGTAVLAVWAVLIAAAFVAHPYVPSSATQVVVSFAYCFEFFLGMGATYLLLSRRIRSSGIVLVAGIVSFFAAGLAEVWGIMDGFGMLARVVYGGCSLLIIIALVERERSGLLKVPKPLAVLGSSSYAVYLVHLIGIGVGFHVISRLVHLTPAWSLPLWFLLCGVGVFSGIATSIWVERPVIRLSRRWLGDRFVRAP